MSELELSEAEELQRLRVENARLRETLDAVKEVRRHGARMDVHPTRMGGSPDTIKEAMWWQSWLIEFDGNWRKYLDEALSKAEGTSTSEELLIRAVNRVLSKATIEEWMANDGELAQRVIRVLQPPTE